MKRLTLLFICILSLQLNVVTAQSRYKKYDSIFYERIFSPTFSTMMMPKGYVEVILSNSLLSTNQYWSDNSKLINYNSRYTYNYSLLQTNIGVSSSSRVSVGFDFYYTMGRNDAERNSSPFHVFNSNAPGNIQSASALSAIAPRIKLVPFKRYKNFIFQTSLYLLMISNNSVKTFLGASETSLRNQFLYSIKISRKLMSFAQADVDVYFKSNNAGESNRYAVPVNLYLYWIATNHIFPYASIGYGTQFQKLNDKFQSNYNYVPVIAGVQYQFSLRFNVNVNYSQYLVARNSGDWRSFNIALRGVF